MENKKTLKQIDFVKIAKTIIKNKKKFLYVLPVAFVVACAIIFPIPRYYTCTVKLAPEISSMNGSSLTDIVSSFGFDLNNAKSQADAISPDLYPQLMESVDFRTSLFPLRVSTLDGKVTTSYYEYLMKYQKKSWVVMLINSLSPSNKVDTDYRKINPFRLTKEQKKINDAIDDNIKCTVDKKTYVISITVTDQDPLVCALMADSVKEKLQDFITKYRTNKANNDLEYTRVLYQKAKDSYEKARQLYAAYSDANTDLVLQSFKSKQEDLENDMQLKYNTYSALATQLQKAQARVQERTPAFTTLQSASVPLRPAGPRRTIFVLIVLVLSFFGTTLYALYKEGDFS